MATWRTSRSFIPQSSVTPKTVANGLAMGSDWLHGEWPTATCSTSPQVAEKSPLQKDRGQARAHCHDPAEKQIQLDTELANGRLATMAIISMFFQDGPIKSAWGDLDSFTASPLRAYKSELSMLAPVGFRNPIGYTADGCVENINDDQQ
jgi:hypothetical protein